MTGLEQYVGQVLDEKYRLESLLGQGGMGAVYLATHLGTGRYVALKLITPQFMRNDEFVERFKREARAAGRLRHPNVVDVTDFGFAQVASDRVAYLVMEYLDGCTLGDVLSEEKRLPLEWVADILDQVCSAVNEAHQQGIVHRDLKPDNIWLEPNRLGGYRVKVLDFGIAKLAEATEPSEFVTAPSELAEQFSAGVSQSFSVSSPGSSEPTLLADSESATLLFPGDEAVTLNLPGAGVSKSRPNESDETQLFTSTSTDHQRTTSTLPGSDPTRTVDEGDATLLLDQATRRGAAVSHSTAGAHGAGLTRVGEIMGTPLYMSPEQCRGDSLDARSDIYSLGVIAYQMLAGEPPFTGSMPAVMRDHQEMAPSPLRSRNKKVAKRAASVVMSALAKDPAHRPQSAVAFSNSLRAQAEGIGALFRRAFSLYSEYFPKFLRISLIAHIPVIVVTFLIVGLRLADKPMRDGKLVFTVAWIALVVVLALLQIAATFLSAWVISGMTVLIVTQLAVAPLRPVELRTALAVLKRRWRPFVNTSLRLMLRIFLGFLCFIIPGLVMMVRYTLTAPVVLIEGLEKRAAMRRARELAARSWRTVIIVVAIQIVIPSVIRSVLGVLLLGSDPKASSSTARQLVQELSGLVNIFIMPMLSIVPALLYLKMRQLGGESLAAALAQIEEAESKRSKWQQRMFSRLTMQSGQASTPANRS